MSTELKPCPFCNEAQSLYVQHVEGTIVHPTYFVKCDNCGAVGPTTDKGNHAELWNRRASSAAAAPVNAVDALPPLPEPYQEAGEEAGCWFPDMFTESQMRSYARAAVEADRAQASDDTVALELCARWKARALKAEADLADRAQQGEPVATETK